MNTPLRHWLQDFLRHLLAVPSHADLERAINRTENRIGALGLEVQRVEQKFRTSERLLGEAERAANRTTVAIYDAAEAVLGMVSFLKELDASTEEELLTALRTLREKEQKHGQIIPSQSHTDAG